MLHPSGWIGGSPVMVDGTLAQLGGVDSSGALTGAVNTSLSPKSDGGSTVDIDIIGAAKTFPPLARRKLAMATVVSRRKG